MGLDCCDLYTMLDGLLLAIGNSFGTILLCVLMTRDELTPKLGELGFKNDFQDTLGYQMRHAKINYPSVGFVRSQLFGKISWGAGLLLKLLYTTVSAKIERIFALAQNPPSLGFKLRICVGLC